MTTASNVSPSTSESTTEQVQAAALWTFISLKTTPFTSEKALEIVRELAPRPREDLKNLAKRLRKALNDHDIAIKHTVALDAAARLLGHSSWHAANRELPGFRLKLTSFKSPTDVLEYKDWRELAPVLCAICEAWVQQQKVRLFTMSLGPSYLAISAHVPEEGKPDQAWPIFVVSPLGESKDWLEGAASTIETIRRHLEETSKAVLDGIAVLQLCELLRTRKGFVAHASDAVLDDAYNSELVVIREDNEDLPGYGYEVARGDELACWSQLELANKENHGQGESIRDGAWFIGEARYIWQLDTIRPHDFVPGLINLVLGQDAVNKLYLRYKRARQVFPNGLTVQQAGKRLEYLGQPDETCRINLHALLLEMNKVGLTWDDYCREIGEQIQQTPILPMNFVLGLVARIKPKDPNVVFARPNRSELTKANDDTLLRALMPRVAHVYYRTPRGLNQEAKDVVKDAIGDFSASLFIQKGGFNLEKPFPHLVYASDAEDLRQKLLEQGLVMYVGVMPWLSSVENIPSPPVNMFPYAFGHAFYLDIDFVDGVQR